MSNMVKVWGPLVRIFHWSLVLFFVIAYITGEEESSLHIEAGYVVLGLISFRFIWGLIGPEYARFSQFVYRPTVVLAYFKSLFSRSPKHYLGHNPLGGWMVIALLLMLFIVSFSGLKLYALEEGKGPLAQNIELISTAYADRDEDKTKYREKEYDEDESEKSESDEDDAEEFWEEIHEASTELLLLLIFVHIAGVFMSSLLHGENLVRAMISGKKKK